MKFIVDFMLGRLCKWLRLAGYDAVFFRGSDKGELIYESLRQNRVVLTRNTRITSKRVLRKVLVESDVLKEQVKQVFDELGLSVSPDRVFSRCLACNGILAETEKEKVEGKVPAYVFQTSEKFHYCRGCGKVYWNGTHRVLVDKKLRELLEK